MEWGIIVALIILIPVMLLPAAYVWYLNIGGIYAAIREARRRRAAGEGAGKAVAQESPVQIISKTGGPGF